MTTKSLSQYQREFTVAIAKLILWANANGYELTFGEAFRTPEQAQLNAKKWQGYSK